MSKSVLERIKSAYYWSAIGTIASLAFAAIFWISLIWLFVGSCSAVSSFVSPDVDQAETRPEGGCGR